mmetsp:Transcript_2674/g.6281  ORF Transcript_2674/g.6281 Transcript_2674/m.6281 type:complete len:564 (-) Transcript_2674:371-2062(-)
MYAKDTLQTYETRDKSQKTPQLEEETSGGLIDGKLAYTRRHCSEDHTSLRIDTNFADTPAANAAETHLSLLSGQPRHIRRTLTPDFTRYSSRPHHVLRKNSDPQTITSQYFFGDSQTEVSPTTIREMTNSSKSPSSAHYYNGERRRRSSSSNRAFINDFVGAQELHLRTTRNYSSEEETGTMTPSSRRTSATDSDITIGVFDETNGQRRQLTALERRGKFWQRVRTRRMGAIGLLMVIVVCMIMYLFMWLRPEILGKDVSTLLFAKSCMVLDSWNLEVAGNANRIESLLIALKLTQRKGYNYLAVDDVWQKWICKTYSDQSILAMQDIVSLVPLDEPYSTPSCLSFQLLHKRAIREPLLDSCEEGWSHSSFFRYLRYHDNDLVSLQDWKFMAPTGRHSHEVAIRNIETMRKEHESKKLVAAHKRWLSRICHQIKDLTQLPSFPPEEVYCHLTPELILAHLAQVGLREEDVYIRMSSDNLVPEEDAKIKWDFEGDDVPFMQQVWFWVYADVFIGNPSSTIDQAACRWRTLFCEDCKPCLPLTLWETAHSGFKSLPSSKTAKSKP